MVLSGLVHFLRRRVRPPGPESEHCLLGSEPTCCSTARLSSPQRQHIDALLVSFMLNRRDHLPTVIVTIFLLLCLGPS
ncbi:unnamed protein product [Brugia pahangi]|uniref:Uncharacterized protein n=1 Tax=Brugia pahangi TaxID=6280 RepID=A0A0N4TJL2_BRUPA|nr:unnamed protein product [Brugia pahangi]